MATFTLAPYAKKQFFDNSGDPLDSGRIYTYLAGTLTAETTYQTSSGTAWGAYVQLDSAGRPTTGDIYLTPGSSYKFIAKDSGGSTIWTQDGIGATPLSAVNVDIQGTAGENLTAGDIAYIGTGGAWFKADADATSSSTAPVLGFVVNDATIGNTVTLRTDGQIELAGPLTPAAFYYVSATAGAVTSTSPSNSRLVGQAQSTTLLAIALNPPVSSSDPRLKTIFNGRLTLTTGLAVTTTDVTAATTVYLALYQGNQFALYTGSAWTVVTLAQLSIAVPATTGTMYDVFLDYNDGTPALAVTAWTNRTTRATALVAQDGVWVKTGDTQMRWVGCFQTTGVSGQTEDSLQNRLVYNYYNRMDRPLLKYETTANWTYTLSTWRQARATATNQVTVVQGIAEDPVELTLGAVIQNSGAGGPAFVSVAVGEDSTTTPATSQRAGFVQIFGANEIVNNEAVYSGFLTGSHDLVWLERSEALGTTTWYSNNGIGTGFGVQSGLMGSMRG